MTYQQSPAVRVSSFPPALNGSSLSVARSARLGEVGRFALGWG